MFNMLLQTVYNGERQLLLSMSLATTILDGIIYLFMNVKSQCQSVFTSNSM